MDFNGGERLQPPRSRLQAVFTMAVNRWQGAESLDLRIEHLQPL